MIIQEDLLLNYGAEMIHLKKSELLFEVDSDPAHYFQIKTGKIKLINFQHENKEFIHSIHSHGEAVGEMFLFTKYTYPVDAISMENCTIFRLEKDKFLDLLKSDFEIQQNFLQYLAEKNYYSYIFLNSITSEDAFQKLTTLLNHLKDNQDDTLYSYQIPYTRKEIAFLTGLRIETVIRTFKKMETENLIKIIKGKVYY